MVDLDLSGEPVGQAIDDIISALKDEIAAREAQIAVEDRGPGIEPSQFQRLLQPFEQGDDALTRSREGAGLGLAITQLLARAMNGQLRLRSSVGAGFNILLLPSA